MILFNYQVFLVAVAMAYVARSASTETSFKFLKFQKIY